MGQNIDKAKRLGVEQEIMDRKIEERLSTANALGWRKVIAALSVSDEGFLRVLDALIGHGRAPADLDDIVIEVGAMHDVSAGKITVGYAAPPESIITHILK